MPITFDTLAELKAFYRDFRLVGFNGNGAMTEEKDEAPRRRGRPAGRKAEIVKTPGKRGRKPKSMLEKAAVIRTPRKPKGETLTAKLQTTIQGFLDAGRSFTANDVYDVLSKKDDSVNKQSVITSVLKQMNSTYQHIEVTERPGNGPRAVKLYNP